MRHLIKGLIAAVAVMARPPRDGMRLQRLRRAGLCRAGRGRLFGCERCGGWVRERLPDPQQQYYWVNQGPTYTGPGNLAPRPVYREGASPATAMATTGRIIARTAITTTGTAPTTAAAC